MLVAKDIVKENTYLRARNSELERENSSLKQQVARLKQQEQLNKKVQIYAPKRVNQALKRKNSLIKKLKAMSDSPPGPSFTSTDGIRSWFEGVIQSFVPTSQEFEMLYDSEANQCT